MQRLNYQPQPLILVESQPAATISFRNPLGNPQEFHENFFCKENDRTKSWKWNEMKFCAFEVDEN
jgi:hypothetical protein